MGFLQLENEAERNLNVVDGVAGGLADVASGVEPDALAIGEIFLHSTAEIHTQICLRRRL